MGDIFKGTSGAKELKSKETWWFLDPFAASEMFSLKKKKCKKINKGRKTNPSTYMGLVICGVGTRGAVMGNKSVF